MPQLSQRTPRPLPRIEAVETWLFDLDNTLYPASCDLFSQIDAKMGSFVEALLGLDAAAAKALQKRYFLEHGTTLNGLMLHHGLNPADYLDFVHDIDLSAVAPAPGLDAALARLPGRKMVFTNASRQHAERVLSRLGVTRHFSEVFDIVAADFRPKPDPVPYDALVARHRIQPGGTVFFEDSARNLAPAHALGMTTVWIEHGASWASAGSEGADFIHHRTEDLTSWLAALT